MNRASSVDKVVKFKQETSKTQFESFKTLSIETRELIKLKQQRLIP